MRRILIYLLLIVGLPSCAFAKTLKEPLAVYLGWKGDPQTTMTVHWVTERSDRSDAVYYFEEGSSQSTRVIGSHARLPEGNTRYIHTVELHNLKPGTNYRFMVGPHPKRYRFRTIPCQTDAEIRFVVGGDVFHDTPQVMNEMHEEAAKTSPHFALVGGDIAYAASKRSWVPQRSVRWMNWIKAWSDHMVTPEEFLIPVVPVLGNHDVTGRYGQTPKQASYYHALFSTPNERSYFALDFRRDLSVLGLDSGHAHSVDGEQKTWLEETLKTREAVKNIFAFYHVPAYPSVRNFENKRVAPVRENWVPLFEKYGLKAAFEHHDHAYKRTHPIYQGKVDPERGVLYLGDGAWGIQKPRQPKRAEDVWYLAKTASVRHVILVTINCDGASFKAIDSNGVVFDIH